MEISNGLVVGVTIVLMVIVTITLIEINNFMPIINSCNDDFAVIEKCGCIPWNYSLTFPQYFKNITTIPNG